MAREKGCLCTNSYTNADCPIHGIKGIDHVAYLEQLADIDSPINAPLKKEMQNLASSIESLNRISVEPRNPADLVINGQTRQERIKELEAGIKQDLAEDHVKHVAFVSADGQGNYAGTCIHGEPVIGPCISCDMLRKKFPDIVPPPCSCSDTHWDKNCPQHGLHPSDYELPQAIKVQPPRGSCTRPPQGWYCPLEHGHDGPCPTYKDYEWQRP